MSALPPEADIRQRIEHVCFVPLSRHSPRVEHLNARALVESYLLLFLAMRLGVA